jgi:copper transport protein
MRCVFALLMTVAAAAILAPAALAHAKFVSSSPPDGVALRSSPADVRVHFDDAITAGPDNEVVRNEGGSVLAGRPRVTRDARTLVLPVRRLPDGDYSVRWRIVSDDGHLEQGVFAFRVGDGTGAAGPTSVLRAEGTRPSVADVISRWLYLGGILVAGGAALFRLAVGRVSANAVAVALASVFLGGSSLLHATASDTRFGHVTQAAVIVAALGATAAAVSTVYARLLDVALLAGLALLVAPSLSGHALDAGNMRPLAFAADLAHVVAAAFWIGGVVQLVLLLRADSQQARRFSRFALPAVVLIGITGVIRALEELARLSQLWTTGYGRTILVKSALLCALVALGWLSRSRLASAARLRRSLGGELAVLSGVVVAVAVLTALAPGRDVRAATPATPAPRAGGPPPLPPRGALVLARPAGDLAVGVAVQRRPLRLTATIVGPDGKGVDGLDVELVAGGPASGASTAGRPCGHGCYTATVPFAQATRVAANFRANGGDRSVGFTLPRRESPGAAFLRRATRSFRALRSVAYVERLSSGRGKALVSRWRLAAPNSLAYEIPGGGAGILIGTRRWDRAAPGARWLPSEATPLPQPEPIWGDEIANARIVRRTPAAVTVAWLNPTGPAWFETTFDARTARPVALRMTAAAHFMQHRYGSFDAAPPIRPPR